jgi:uncharacterized protein (DUF952 family)
MTLPDTIYRLIDAETWSLAVREGCFAGTEHDRRDGFIHFSTAQQVAETARRHYPGQSSLLLLVVSTKALGAALRWEPSRGGESFPHLYASLAPSAVVKTLPLPLGPGGEHVFPDSSDW